MSKKIDRTGEINYNKQGMKMWIKEYRNSRDIDIEFENGYIAYNKSYNWFEQGLIRNKNVKIIRGDKIDFTYRVGETNYNNNGTKMTIIEYIDSQNVLIEFDDNIHKYRKNCSYRDFKIGKPSSPYDKKIFGIGYLGAEKQIGINNDFEYSRWHHILERCYGKEITSRNITYKDCQVCEEWYNFQNFKKWFDENYYQVNDEKMCIDKDILIKWNKIYSPNTCLIVPENINKLFVREKSRRGNTPIGVSIYDNVIYARMSKVINGKWTRIEIGSHYNNTEQAFYAYKKEKEKHIKEIADLYKDKIPKRLYDAMYNYIVEITD
jgi:hypothetical protein